MSVKVKNVSDKSLTLEINTLDRAKGVMFKELAPKGEIIIDEGMITDQMKVLAVTKKKFPGDRKMRGPLIEIEPIEETKEQVPEPPEDPPAPVSYAPEEDEELDEDTL